MSNLFWGILNGACIGFFLCCFVYWDALSLVAGSEGLAQSIAGLVIQGKLEQYIGLGALLGALAGLAYNQTEANKRKEPSEDQSRD